MAVRDLAVRDWKERERARGRERQRLFMCTLVVLPIQYIDTSTTQIGLAARPDSPTSSRLMRRR